MKSEMRAKKLLPLKGRIHMISWKKLLKTKLAVMLVVALFLSILPEMGVLAAQPNENLQTYTIKIVTAPNVAAFDPVAINISLCDQGEVIATQVVTYPDLNVPNNSYMFSLEGYQNFIGVDTSITPHSLLYVLPSIHGLTPRDY